MREDKSVRFRKKNYLYQVFSILTHVGLERKQFLAIHTLMTPSLLDQKYPV